MGFMDWLRSQPEISSSPHIMTPTEIQLTERLDDALVKIEDLEESLLEVADAFDNIGWSPMGFSEPQQINEIPLKTVKTVAEIARAIDAVNPFIKSGVNARVSYIWGNGVEFEGLDDATKKAIRKNRDTIFSQQAYEERERAAATDGNVFTLLHREDFSTIRVPLANITGSISNPENDEEVWYYKREWTTKTNSSANDGEVDKVKQNVRWYPSIRYAQKLEEEGRSLPKRWGKYGVDQQYVMQHVAVNKQIGWRWGLPDIMPVIYWAKAYKEFLEDNLTLVKAYSRIAMQIKNANAGTANSAAAQWVSTPTLDPITGRASTIGATAFTGHGTEIVATGLNGSEVKFDNGDTIASAIAAGLEVSLSDILPAGENINPGVIENRTLKAMETRQNMWENAFLDLFEFWGDEDAKVTWRNISEDETHRRVQSIQLAYDGGQLFQDESRKETLEMLRIVPLHPETEMPVAPAIVAAEKAAENAEKVAAAKPATGVPSQGRAGGVGSVNSGRGQVKQAVKKAMANK